MADTLGTSPDNRPRLTDWAKEPTLMELKLDLEEARSSHVARVSEIELWLDNMHVRGKAKVDTGVGNSKVVPKLIRKQAEWRYSSLSDPFLSTPNLFKVKPVTWEDRGAADQNMMVLNHQFNNRIKKQKFIDDYVRTAVDEGTVIIKVGWEHREEKYKETVPVIELTQSQDPAYLQQLQQWMQLQQENPAGFSELPPEVQQAVIESAKDSIPYVGKVVGTKVQDAVRVLKNQPTLEICDFRNVIIDPTCQGDIDKAGFVIHRFESSLSELKADGRYKNLEFIEASSNSPLGEPDYASASTGSKNFNYADKARKKFVVYEYWGFRDIDNSGVVSPVLVTWVGNNCIRMETNPFPDKKVPFVLVPYMPVRRDSYGETDGALLEDNQQIIGATVRGMIDIMAKSANGQTGILKGALDTTNKRRFDRGEDYEINAQADPRSAIFMHTFPNIPQSAQFMLQMQNMEAESLTGVKAFNNGISGESLGPTAAGVRGALDASSKRELGILRRLSNGMVEVGHKLISMNAVFLSDVEVVRVTNDQFVPVRRDDLAGAFDLELTITTAEEDNAKAQELAFMLQTMGNSVDFGITQMVLEDIASLRKMPDLAHRIKMYQPQPDPMQQQKAQLELALLQAQIATEQAKAAHYGSGAQLQGAKIGTEQAKARHVTSQADLTDLNFVEQESGVKQHRDLQKQGAQAQAQGQLQILEHQLAMKEQAKAEVLGNK
jgi:hypothetical protein